MQYENAGISIGHTIILYIRVEAMMCSLINIVNIRILGNIVYTYMYGESIDRIH